MTAPVLLIEDANTVLSSCGPALSRAGYAVHSARTAAEGYRAFHDLHPGVVLLDPVLPDGDGIALMQDCRQRDARARFVVVPTPNAACCSAQALRAGADEVLLPPVDVARLVSAVSTALAGTAATVAPRAAPTAGLIGTSAAMQDVRARLRAAAGSAAPVFLRGETGTGKALCARALHDGSVRAQAPFIAMACAALAGDTLEQALAATLAEASDVAMGPRAGTLFLDDICELDPAAQARLLSLLRDRSGDRQSRMRLICATSRDPVAELRADRLRPDLFYQLNVVPIALPPLRARGEDAAEIAARALPGLAAEEGKRFSRIASRARQRLLAHDWPGNVRELLNVLRAAVILHDGTEIEPHMLPDELPPVTDTLPVLVPRPPALDAVIGRPLAEIEKLVIEATIQEQEGSLPRAARILGVSPSTLYRKREGWHRVTDA